MSAVAAAVAEPDYAVAVIGAAASIITGFIAAAAAIAMKKMKTSNTADHGEVVLALTTVNSRLDDIRDTTSTTAKQLVRHLENHDL